MADDLERISDILGPGPHTRVVSGESGLAAFGFDGCSSEMPVCDDGLRMAIGYAGPVEVGVQEGVDAPGLTLASSDPDVFDVAVAGRGFSITAVAPGAASLVALDGEGTEIDRVTMEVAEVSGITWVLEDHADGDIVGEGVSLPVGEDVELFVEAFDVNHQLLMVNLDWEVLEGDDQVSIGVERLHEFSYVRTIMGWQVGPALVRINVQEHDIDIPVDVRPFR